MDSVKHTSLAHHGIFGQKWHIRRFQNPDGTLTEAGKRRYSRDAVDSREYRRDQSAPRQAARTARFKADVAKQRLDTVEVKKASKVQTGVNNIEGGVNKIASVGRQSNRYASNHKTLSTEEMSQISDADLQKLVNRLNMETNYTRLTEEPRAIDYVADGIGYVAAFTSIAVGALTVYNQFKK